MAELSEIVKRLNVEVKGVSALCVTPCGINLFSEKLKFKERKYVCSEHILKKDGQLIVSDNPQQKEREGYILINRCRMLLTTPKEESSVWNYFSI